MRIAVIGATGMLGHHVAVAAAGGGHDLVVTYRNLHSLAVLGSLKCDARQADLNGRTHLRTALTDVDAVINCDEAAAVMSSGQFIDGTKALSELDCRAQIPVDEAIARALKWFHAKGLARAA